MESTLQTPALVAAKNTPRAKTIVYWIVTALFCLEMSFTACYMLMRLPEGRGRESCCRYSPAQLSQRQGADRDTFQNTYFRPSCTCRMAVEVPVTMPNPVWLAVVGMPGCAAPAKMFKFGMAKFGWFRTLNASSRNCKIWPSL